MPSLQVVCGFCRRRAFAQSAAKGSAGMRQNVAFLYSQGWTGSADHQSWACSDDCRAWLAKDVTPRTKEAPRVAGLLSVNPEGLGR